MPALPAARACRLLTLTRREGAVLVFAEEADHEDLYRQTLARLAGVSVRTLHHYDEIGLLRPAFTGENRYRYYGEDEVLRLQQILIHRALDIPLTEIGAILDAPGFDVIAALRRQRQSLEEKPQRFAGMVKTIDRTIAHLTGDMTK